MKHGSSDCEKVCGVPVAEGLPTPARPVVNRQTRHLAKPASFQRAPLFLPFCPQHRSSEVVGGFPGVFFWIHSMEEARTLYSCWGRIPTDCGNSIILAATRAACVSGHSVRSCGADQSPPSASPINTAGIERSATNLRVYPCYLAPIGASWGGPVAVKRQALLRIRLSTSQPRGA